jgi:hypothetical protein
MKIGLLGAQGTGKTTVFNEVVKRIPDIGKVSEVARACPFPINEKSGFRAQEWIFREQVRRELEYPIDSLVISDRTTIDQVAYVRNAYENGNMTTEEMKYLESKLLAWVSTYDFLIYYPIMFPLEGDGVRSTNKSFQHRIDRLILKTIAEHGPYWIHTETEKSIPKRVERVMRGIYVLKSVGVQ